MPWAQLTRFTAIELTVDQCLFVLRRATALKEFRLELSPEDDNLSVGPPVCHADLISLAIETYCEVDSILEYLTLPRLQELRLQSQSGKHLFSDDWNNLILEFLTRISPTLKTLAIGIHLAPVD
jgi:hypothetical protein